MPELQNSSTSPRFYTGKPKVAGLGYAFLFRNYRPELGKWQTADPIGYPDGWNNLAYVNNGVTMALDWLGAKITLLDPKYSDFPASRRADIERQHNALKQFIDDINNGKVNPQVQGLFSELQKSSVDIKIRIQKNYIDENRTAMGMTYPANATSGDSLLGISPLGIMNNQTLLHEMVHACENIWQNNADPDLVDHGEEFNNVIFEIADLLDISKPDVKLGISDINGVANTIANKLMKPKPE